jgi:hypothetical protein
MTKAQRREARRTNNRKMIVKGRSLLTLHRIKLARSLKANSL